MNWDQIAGNLKQVSGKVREKWGKLTDDDVQLLKGHRDQFIGRLQERYGISREEAHKQLDEFLKAQGESEGTRRAGGY